MLTSSSPPPQKNNAKLALIEPTSMALLTGSMVMRTTANVQKHDKIKTISHVAMAYTVTNNSWTKT